MITPETHEWLHFVHVTTKPLRSGEKIQKSANRKRRSTQISAFESLYSIAREMKTLKSSNDATEASVNSMSERLSLALAVVLTAPSATSPLRDVQQSQVKLVLQPVLRRQLSSILLKSSRPVLIQAGRLPSDDRVLPIFAPSSDVTSTGFRIMWSAYQNVHRQVVQKLSKFFHSSKCFIRRILFFISIVSYL